MKRIYPLDNFQITLQKLHFHPHCEGGAGGCLQLLRWQRTHSPSGQTQRLHCSVQPLFVSVASRLLRQMFCRPQDAFRHLQTQGCLKRAGAGAFSAYSSASTPKILPWPSLALRARLHLAGRGKGKENSMSNLFYFNISLKDNLFHGYWINGWWHLFYLFICIVFSTILINHDLASSHFSQKLYNP